MDELRWAYVCPIGEGKHVYEAMHQIIEKRSVAFQPAWT